MDSERNKVDSMSKQNLKQYLTLEAMRVESELHRLLMLEAVERIEALEAENARLVQRDTDRSWIESPERMGR